MGRQLFKQVEKPLHGQARITNQATQETAIKFTMIRYGQLTEDEVFVSHEAATAGVTFENLSRTDPLVTLRYFGPGACPDAPDAGAWKKLA